MHIRVRSLPRHWLSHAVIAILAFQSGFFLGGHHGLNTSSSAAAPVSTEEHWSSLTQSFLEPPSTSRRRSILSRIQDRLTPQELALLKTELKGCTTRSATTASSDNEEEDSSNTLLPSQNLGRFAVAMARTSRLDFGNQFDLGVPLDAPSTGSTDVLMIYSSNSSRPDSSLEAGSNAIPRLAVNDAVERCDYMNIVFTHPGHDRSQCIAIMPQYESYHLQKWMRVNHEGKLSSSAPLQLVSRGHQPNGKQQFLPPDLYVTRASWDMLNIYLNSIDSVLAELRPIVRRIARDHTVVVMVCNFGQAELLMNFVCSAKARGLDITSVLVFTTDQETKDLAESIGLAAYFDKRNFGDLPTAAAANYGDETFSAMMMAKVYCVQMIAMLEDYDILFQDVDVVWYKDPLEFFHNQSSSIQHYDMIFQDDGGRSVRYAPYSANSGFYYVRRNGRTRHLLTSLLMAGDIVLGTKSHQQALISLLAEHVSLYGLKVKVLNRDTEEFPGGFHFHKRSRRFFMRLFSGKVHPYIFHMSWTINKNNKLLFFRQTGNWYVQDQCISKSVSQIESASKDLTSTCCAIKPLVSCHYRDKPSVIPCKDSPPIDKNGKSFW